MDESVSNAEDQVTILAELVGAYHLQLESHVTGVKEKHLRPFCLVKFHNRRIHYSSPCSEKGRDPIWTVSTGSLFLVKVSPRTLVDDTLQITVWSRKNSNSLRDTVLCDTDSYFLGKVNIDGHTILSNCSEQRLELKLEDRHGNEIHKDCIIAMRFRIASESDIRLIEVLREQGISPPEMHTSFSRSSSELAVRNSVKDLILREERKHLPIAHAVSEAHETKVAGDFFVDTITSAFKPSTKCDRETGLRKVRVKPGPDPARVEGTKYMSPLEIDKATHQPSQKWVEAGSGHLGTLHLEILSCHDLPNVDVGEAVGNLTDCFVTAVFEDVMLQTPVIDDELSPHWLPWTNRAFRVGIVHPSSILYLAAFDYDFASEHEALGRVAINLSNFQTDTLYTLTYKLHPTSDLLERTPNGTITIRLRIEYKDEKAALMAARQPPPTFHVNAQNSKTFKILRYTCYGEYDNEEKFVWAVTRSYIFEVLDYWRDLKFYIKESSRSLVFWRGQVQLFSMNLPVHSAILFCSGVILVEKPWLIVPFCFLSVAWFLLATMAHRRKNPSPWHSCTPFMTFAEILLTGKSSNKILTIRPAQYLKQTEEYENSVKVWKELYQSSVDKAAELEEKLMAIGDENISTEVSGQLVPLELLEKLGRYQGILGRLCTKLRRVNSVITWEDSAVSFWITAKFLAIGTIMLLLPWRFLLYAVGRVVVWGFLGPQMKLVDLYFKSKKSRHQDEEAEEYRRQARLARIRREEAVKIKDFKCLAFGGYVTLVPSENLPRHFDRPLHESFARYLSPSSAPKLIPATSRIPGQQLYGVMVPHTKTSLTSCEEEVKRRELRLAALEVQVKRLKAIEEHVSSRAIGSDLDKDLPEDLGYEVALSEDLLHLGEESGDEEEEDCDSADLSGQSMSQEVNDCVSQEDDLSTKSSQNYSDASEGPEVEGDCNQISPAPSQNNSFPKFKRQSVFEPGIEVEPDESFMTPVTQQTLSLEQESSLLEKHSSESQEEETEDSDVLTLLTPTEDNEGEQSKQTEDVYYLTPEHSEEEKKEQDDPSSDELQLHFRDSSDLSQEDVDSRPSGRHQLMGPRHKAMVWAKSIGSGALPCDHDYTEDEKYATSIQAMCIASGSLRSGSEGDLKPGNCQFGTEKNKLTVDTDIANSERIDDAELLTPLTTHCVTRNRTSSSDVDNFLPCHSMADNNFGATDQALNREAPISLAAGPNTNHPILPSATDTTEATNNTSRGTKLPSFAQSLNTQETDIRRTWSSGSLQRENTWIKENPTDSVLDLPQRSRGSMVVAEEGLEIVAMGRLAVGLSDDDCSIRTGTDTEDPDVPESPHRGLSVPYKSNSFVQVAVYRP